MEEEYDTKKIERLYVIGALFYFIAMINVFNKDLLKLTNIDSPFSGIIKFKITLFLAFLILVSFTIPSFRQNDKVISIIGLVAAIMGLWAYLEIYILIDSDLLLSEFGIGVVIAKIILFLPLIPISFLVVYPYSSFDPPQLDRVMLFAIAILLEILALLWVNLIQLKPSTIDVRNVLIVKDYYIGSYTLFLGALFLLIGAKRSQFEKTPQIIAS